MEVKTARKQNKSAASSSHLSDDEIMQLVLEGTQRGRPENPSVPDQLILDIVKGLMRQKGRRVGVSIATIANQLPEFSHYDVHKRVLYLINTRALRRCNLEKSGESAKIILGRAKRR